MVGSTGTLMTMRLVRSKLRKRDETTAVSPPSTGRITTQRQQQHHIEANNHNHHQNHLNQININNHHNNINSNHHSQHHQITTTTTTIATISSQQHQVLINENGIIQNNNGTFKQEQPQENGWVFPPLPPQPNIYCMNTTDAFAHLQDKSGFKRFRTQFSGRFKRLVAKKTQEPPAIPPELRPQLKTIYVY